MFRSTALALVVFALNLLVLGSPQDEWSNPALPDYSSSFNQGDLVTIRWTSKLQTHFKTSCPKCDPTKVELWITGGGGSTFTAHQLSSSMNAVDVLYFRWKVDVPGPSEIVNWVLRLTPPGGWSEGGQEVSSPMFAIKRDSSKSSSVITKTISTSAKSSPTSMLAPGALGNSAVATTASTAAPTVDTSGPDPSTSPETIVVPSSEGSAGDKAKEVVDGSSKLGPGIIAGVVVGAVAGILLAVSAGCCYYRRRKARGVGTENHSVNPMESVSTSRGLIAPEIHRPALLSILSKKKGPEYPNSTAAATQYDSQPVSNTDHARFGGRHTASSRKSITALSMAMPGTTHTGSSLRRSMDQLDHQVSTNMMHAESVSRASLENDEAQAVDMTDRDGSSKVDDFRLSQALEELAKNMKSDVRHNDA